uniref:BHLH domain-containing protein n=2 Tax=Oryza brachyantha TaxID=4533 RepID=J3LZ42_ORYBR
MRQHQHYGGGSGAEISLGHGHHFHQFGVEAKDGGGGGGADQSAFLARHNSSPPGFFSSPVMDNGFSSSGRAGSLGEVRHAAMSSSSNNKKMKAPLNFASRQGSLSQISEDGIPDLTDNMHGGAHGRSEENVSTDHVVRSFSGGFSIGSWEDSNSIVFSTSTGKSGVHGNDDIIATLSNYESQLVAPREMAGVEKYLQMQHDQVPFRVRAKRGCATHPRSIAERERRTRISEKLRKLQALVPNMDKQTSTSDMLDLAVEHIKGLQSQLKTLKEDKEKCTCSCNRQASRNRSSAD